MAPGTLCGSVRAHATLAFLLAVVVLLLPPLVHATQHLDGRHDTSRAFRLKRAFDVPQSKWTVGPLVVQRIAHAPVERSAPSPRRRAIADVHILAEHQHDRSPDPLRGPPLI